MSHNIVSGHVTRSTNDSNRRRTPNWLKVVYAFFAVLVAVVTLSLTLAPSSDEPVKPNPTTCEK